MGKANAVSEMLWRFEKLKALVVNELLLAASITRRFPSIKERATINNLLLQLTDYSTQLHNCAAHKQHQTAK
jgi:hypothetical protein